MPKPRRVIVYGNTLALAGIAIALENRPDLQVVTVAEACPSETAPQSGEEDVFLDADIAIFDAAQTDMPPLLARLPHRNNLLVIGLDANNNQMLVWSGQSSQAATIQDLVHVIERA
jgi:hypothetical protein